MADSIALVGSETLLGHEVRQVLGETALGQDLRLIAGESEQAGTLTEIGGAASILSKLDPDAVEDAAAVILAGSTELTRQVLDMHPPGTLIDLTYGAEEEPEARVRAPLVEGTDYSAAATGPQIVAHPAAIAIAYVLGRLQETYPIERTIVHVFEPASERGKEGVEELQQQTVNLLSLQPVPKRIFDHQLSFNMLAQLGEEAPTPLREVEERIERHLASLLERFPGVPMPSLRLIQAPVFHGYSMSLWIEFETAPAPSELEDILADESIDVRSGDTEPPNNVGVAGQSGISVGAISPDRNDANAIWMWMAVDNLRIAAENAAMIAREVV